MRHIGAEALRLPPGGPDNRIVNGLTIGITTARFAECKRGVAVNVAASWARDEARGSVCVVDADPLTLDVTTRLAVRGPYLEDFAESADSPVGGLGNVHEPNLSVLPSTGGSIGLTQRAIEHALPRLRGRYDIVVVDLVGGPTGPERAVGRLNHLDWLLVAVTPDVEPVEATAGFLERFDAARASGEISGAPAIGIVTTGDEGSVGRDGTSEVSAEVIERALGRPVVGSVRQLWGRSVPNLGFGAALGIAELDDAVAALGDRLAGFPNPTKCRPEPVFSRGM